MYDDLINEVKRLGNMFDARSDGAKAHEQGIPLEDCPHTDEIFAAEWKCGWHTDARDALRD